MTRATTQAQKQLDKNDNVWVGCKIPNGLQIYVENFIEQEEPVIGGGQRTFKRSVRDPRYPIVVLKGPAVPFGVRPDWDIKGGYGFTLVPREIWEQWAPCHRDFTASRMIIAGDTQDEAFGIAKDNKDLRSGLQPMRRDAKDPRMPKLPSMIQIQEGTTDE